MTSCFVFFFMTKRSHFFPYFFTQKQLYIKSEGKQCLTHIFGGCFWCTRSCSSNGLRFCFRQFFFSSFIWQSFAEPFTFDSIRFASFRLFFHLALPFSLISRVMIQFKQKRRQSDCGKERQRDTEIHVYLYVIQMIKKNSISLAYVNSQ